MRQPCPPSIEFETTEPVIVASHTDRLRAGLDHWVDGTMGFARVDNSTLVIAPNGRRLARHRMERGGLLAGLEAADQPIVGALEPVDHASGGPLLVTDDGDVLLVYHAERFRRGDPMDYWSFLGMAVSHDRGATFEDLGRVLTSVVDEDALAGERPVEVGPGGCVVHDGWLLVFFMDRAIRTRRINLGVARAPLADVVSAAAEGVAPVFTKYAGQFSSAGLGGPATDLFADLDRPVIWYDVARLAGADLILLVYSTVLREIDGVPQWMHLGSCSRDGLRWSEPRPLYRSPSPHELIYLSIDSSGAAARSVDGPVFDLYRTVSRSTDRWADAFVERVSVRWRLG